MAFKTINDIAGPDGLIPILFVFGAYLRIVESDLPNPFTTQRAIIIKKAMTEIAKLYAKRQITNALNMRNGSSTTEVYDLPLNSPILIWREGNTG